MSTNLGSTDVNDFPNPWTNAALIVYLNRHGRTTAHDILNYNVKNSSGGLVPFSSFPSIEWLKGPTEVRPLQPPSRQCDITERRRTVFTSGHVIAEMETAGRSSSARLRRRMDRSVVAGTARRTRQAPFPLALSALVVFLCLAVLYESWTISLAVLLTVPSDLRRGAGGDNARGLPNDVASTVGLVTIIGLVRRRHPHHRVRQGFGARASSSSKPRWRRARCASVRF